MRKVVSSLAAAALAAGLLMVVAAPAGASVPAKTTPFCKALKNFDASSLGNPTSERGASKNLKQLKKLQAAAKGDLRKSMTRIVNTYQKFADGESARVLANGTFVKALGAFALAASRCVLPNINLPSLPDIDLPGQ